jgi:hypothetical protein
MDPHLEAETVKDPERIVAYVVTVHVRHDHGVYVKLIAEVLFEHSSGSFHRTETTVDQHSGAVGPDKQAIAAATAAQALEL